MIRGLEGWHFIIILVIVLLLWGAPKLPGLAKSLGQSLKIFKSEIKSAETPEVWEETESNLYDESGDEVGGVRAGRLVGDGSDAYGDTRNDVLADDVGIDGDDTNLGDAVGGRRGAGGFEVNEGKREHERDFLTSWVAWRRQSSICILSGR